MLHPQNKMQISGRMEQTIQTQSGIHEIEITQTPQGPAPLDVCDQPGTNGRCGSGQHVGADHANDHPHEEEANDGTEQQNGGTNHESDGSDHEQNDH